MRIAVSHPGKIGDLLFALPTARYLSAHHGCPVDVFTSPYCRAAIDVIAHQPYVGKAVVLEDYVMDHFLWGAQPWQMPVPAADYDEVYHLGFREFPDRHTVRYVAHQIGLPEPDPDTFTLAVPDTGLAGRRGLELPYVVITGLSSTGGGSLTWNWSNEKVSAFVEACPYRVYAVGFEDEWRQYRCYRKFTGLPGLTLLEVAEVMRNAHAVVTYSTGLGVLASGALAGSTVRLVCLFDGEISWETFRLPGALTCSPDEDLAAIVFRQRTFDELERGMAERERARREGLKTQRLLEEARLANDDLQRRSDDLQRAADDMHRTIDDLRRGLAEVTAAQRAAEHHVAAMQASKSWRWTRPLRALFPARPNDRAAS
jgi:hypothetical protein